VSLPVPPALVADTDVVSYLLKRDTRATFYRRQLTGRLIVVSFMTVAELDHWAEIRRWGVRRREQMEELLSGYGIHFPDRDACRVWARVRSSARRAGRPIGPSDAWIATAALLYDAELVTHNPNDFAGVSGLSIVTAPGP
jgi:predicted nucleic acid-binding protein